MAAVVPFEPRHLTGIFRLCEAEGWPSLPADPTRAQKILTGPDATTLVAIEHDVVIGFAFALADRGPLDGYLSMLAVDREHRRGGIARLLIAAVFAATGVERIDLLAEPGSEPFYESFPHRTFAGYRIYPQPS